MACGAKMGRLTDRDQQQAYKMPQMASLRNSTERQVQHRGNGMFGRGWQLLLFLQKDPK
jgi:hypothetical protein